MALGRCLFSVFPTYVGVIPYGGNAVKEFQGIPHVCGGDPTRIVDT